jgi:hypothetical protein
LDEENDVVIGSSTCDIKSGQELVQSYGNDLATTEIMFRCGFVLTELQMKDVVSISWDQVLGLSNCAKKTAAVQDSCIMQPSPWYGLDSLLTVEIPFPKEDAQALESFAWLRQLCVACFIADCAPTEFDRMQTVVTGFVNKSPELFNDILDAEDSNAVAWAVLAQFSLDTFQDETMATAELVVQARRSVCNNEKDASDESESEENGDGDDDDDDDDDDGEEEEPLWEVISTDFDPWKKYKDRVLALIHQKKEKLGSNSCSDQQVKHLVSQEHRILDIALKQADDFFGRTFSSKCST